MNQLTFQETASMSTTLSTITYGASGVSVFLGLTVDEWGIIGVIVGMSGVVITCVFNMWFKMKYQRDPE